MKYSLPPLIRYRFVIAVLLTMLSLSAVYADDDGDASKNKNIITAIVSAPVVANGLIAGEPTEINILLNAAASPKGLDLDPTYFGHQIPAGGRMEVQLSDEFIPNPEYVPAVAPFTPNANLILTTGAQNPILADAGDRLHFGNWRVEYPVPRLISVVPNGGQGDAGLENARAQQIGVKIIHIRPGAPRNISGTPFFNGEAGEEAWIKVRIYDAENKLIESGYKEVEFESADEAGRKAYVTNAGLVSQQEVSENTDFQHVAPGTQLTNTQLTTPFSAGAPYAPRFLLFESLATSGVSYIPQPGLDNVSYIVDPRKPWRAQVMQDNKVIGRLLLKGPNRRSRGVILASPGATVANGNGSVFNVPVQVGQQPGVYRLKLSLKGGGRAVNTIIVE